MLYKLRFDRKAKKAWDALDSATKARFKKKLAEIVNDPHVPKNRLQGYRNFYKIKLMSPAYRLVYHVDDDVITVTVLLLGTRDKIYTALEKRF